MTLTVTEFFCQFPTDDACLEHLWNVRFGDEVLFRRLFDAGSPRLFDVTGARISQIVRSFPDR